MNKLLTLLILILITSCGTTLTGYTFETEATYQANVSNLQVDITATGKVNAGEDVGNGQAQGYFTSSQFQDTIYFKSNNSQLTSLTYKLAQIKLSNPSDISGTLITLFDEIKFSSYDTSEIEELGSIILATASGPKGTYLEGQTELIKVIKVDFHRD